MGGGGGEIRTHEGLPLAGFQDRCLQPLGHTSGSVKLNGSSGSLPGPGAAAPALVGTIVVMEINYDERHIMS